MLEEQIQKDYIQAMKEKNTVKAGVLSFLRAQLKNVLINEKKDTLDDTAVIAVIKKQVKQREDSIEQFKNGGRQDLVEKEQAEVEVLRSYLPEEMPEEELKKLVQEVITQSGASSMKDMGQVMKEVIARAAGGADNKRVSALVKQELSDK